MTGRLSFRFLAHTWISDWNHGNAHFLRGLTSELVKLGHEVRCYEERDGWSMRNLMAESDDAAAQALIGFRKAFANLAVRFYSIDSRGLKVERQVRIPRALSRYAPSCLHEPKRDSPVSAE